MHYYNFNIGDYRRDTNHLTIIEHGIYRSLLDTYYLNEKPLCDDIALLMRMHCVISNEEKEALKNVLKDFFILTKKGYTHKKCEEQISKYNAKSEKARASANARWNAKAMRSHSKCNANHKPITNNHKPINKDIDRFDEFWNLYDKKQQKPKCLSKWKRLKKSDIDLIFEKLPAYIKSTPDKSFRKNPLTWLNGECWNDEIISKKQNSSNQDFSDDSTDWVNKDYGLI